MARHRPVFGSHASTKYPFVLLWTFRGNKYTQHTGKGRFYCFLGFTCWAWELARHFHGSSGWWCSQNPSRQNGRFIVCFFRCCFLRPDEHAKALPRCHAAARADLPLYWRSCLPVWLLSFSQGFFLVSSLSCPSLFWFVVVVVVVFSADVLLASSGEHKQPAPGDLWMCAHQARDWRSTMRGVLLIERAWLGLPGAVGSGGREWKC